jgi:hypothetical protein
MSSNARILSKSVSTYIPPNANNKSRRKISERSTGVVAAEYKLRT